MAPLTSAFFSQVAMALGALGSGFVALRLAWRYIKDFFDLFGHGKRLKALEDSVAMKADLERMAEEFRDMHDEHVSSDAEHFRIVNEELRVVRDNMARRDDLVRLQENLSRLLLDNFGGGKGRS